MEERFVRVVWIYNTCDSELAEDFLQTMITIALFLWERRI
jgi:hypothetical protein